MEFVLSYQSKRIRMTGIILYAIIGITVLISMNAMNNSDLKYKMMFIPYRVNHNKEYPRILSHVFIHADWGHLFFNMFSLYFLGKVLLFGVYLDDNGNVIYEGFMQTYGNVNGQIHFVLLFVLGGIFASIIPYLRHRENPNYMSLGASGAVSAVIFAFILWCPTMELNLLFIPIPIPAFIFGPLYIGLEIYLDKRGKGNVAHDAHLGGAIFGILYVLFINIDKGKGFILSLTEYFAKLF